jgi:membrane-associated phospholipid phosphatase
MERPALEWQSNWKRFSTTESIVTTALALQAASALLLYPTPKANWRGGILFDDGVRGALRLGDRSARDKAARWSDHLYHALLAYPLLVDTAVVTWGVRGSNDVATEMLAMNLEAYAFTGAIAVSAEKLGRVRPAARGCQDDPSYSDKCGKAADLNSSFLSGHTSLAFASAGLMCAHHQNLELYGGGVADVLACLGALSAASTAGVLRVMSDNHYASDVLLGMGVGLLGGYGLPTLLHYSHGRSAHDTGLLPVVRSRFAGTEIVGVLAPQLAAGYAGVTFVGAF